MIKRLKQDEIYLMAFRMLTLLISAVIVCRITKGVALFLIVYAGVMSVRKGEIFWGLSVYAFLTFCSVVSPVILPRNGLAWGIGLRVGVLVVSVMLAFNSQNRMGGYRLPFEYMFLYLLVATLSLPDSWAPLISSLKLVQFALFVLGFWLGTQNMHHRSKEVSQLRALFIAFALFIIIGSILVYPFPVISYSTTFRYAQLYGNLNEALAEFLANRTQMMTLYSGITTHSQTLAPLLVILFSWLICDMLFVERAFHWGHLLMLLCTLPLLFMTRSRVGFFSLIVSMMMIYFYAIKRIPIDVQFRGHIHQGMAVFGALVLMLGIVSEIKGNTVTRWLRKTDNVESDSRTFSDAITRSRMSCIDESLMEFRRHPLVGSGFQVAWYFQKSFSGGFLLSASIEKGVLPIMILGETGIIGIFAFIVFLICFTKECIRKKYYVSLMLFVIFGVTNLGEATFFSPGGVGGFEWTLCMVGGFLIDTLSLTTGQNPPENKLETKNESASGRAVHW